MTTALHIRYANPDTTPSRYPSAGWLKADVVMTNDYWTLRGPEWALRSHVKSALNDNNLNDYHFVSSR
jgi:hypothetical protein